MPRCLGLSLDEPNKIRGPDVIFGGKISHRTNGRKGASNAGRRGEKKKGREMGRPGVDYVGFIILRKRKKTERLSTGRGSGGG